MENVESRLVSVRTADRRAVRFFNGEPDETEALTTILNGNEGVYVLGGEDDYLKKTAGELEKGDDVLWNASRVDSKLSLMADQEYRSAKSQIYLDVGGRAVPRFQYELLMACAKKGIIDQETLEYKLSTDSLSLSELKSAVDYIHEEYNALWEGHAYAFVLAEERGTIRNWVSGNALGLIKPETLLNLRRALEHEPFLEMSNASFRRALKVHKRTKGQIARINPYLTFDLERVLGVESLDEVPLSYRERLESDAYVRVKGAGTGSQKFLIID